MSKFAFWNDGEPTPIRNKRVTFPNGDQRHNLHKPLPEHDIYLYVEVAEPLGRFKQPGVATCDNDGWTITETIPAVWLSPVTIVETLIAEARSHVFTHLSGRDVWGDWQVVKAQEAGVLVGSAVTAYREAVRTACNNFEAAIDAILSGEGSDDAKAETLSAMAPVWPDWNDYAEVT